MTESAELAPAPPAMPRGAQARPAFSIIPVQAIPIVAVVLGGLAVSIAGNWLWALDFYHVVGGGLWTGVDLFVGFVVGPDHRPHVDPGARRVLRRFMPKMLLLMPTLVTMTLASGWQLARHLGNLQAGYPHHAWLVASYIVVGVMALVAIAILEPANLAVLFELKKPQPDGELIARLMRRFIYTAGITGVAQIATLVIMTRVAVA